ncbi:MAG: cupredoxin family protein [Reyranella sp.]|nr:cupredoxin family protein [Reyranella sp.]
MRSVIVVASVFTALAALAASGIAVASPGHAPGEGHGHSVEKAYGKPGDPKKPARIIQIVMRESDGKMLFLPDKIKIRKGEQIRFQLRNNGVLDHEIVLATLAENMEHMKEMAKNPDMEHDDPNAKRLKPKGTGEIVWQFTKAGTFDFSCLIPGHRESGMFGTIVVE